MRAATVGLFVSALTLGGASTALADVIVLRNGRKLEGEVTKRSKTVIKLRLSWGVMTIPRSRIRSIKEKSSAKSEYKARLKKTDMSDPVAVTKLAEWAAKRGLGKQARELGAQSLEMKLEARLADAKERGTVAGWVETYHWARSNGVDKQAQLSILISARRVGPSDRRVSVALGHFRSDVAAEERRLKKLAEIEARPRYAMPKEQSFRQTSRGPVSVSGKVTLKAMLKPERNRKKILAQLANYRRAAATLAGAKRWKRTDPRDQVEEPKQAKKAKRAKKDPKTAR